MKWEVATDPQGTPARVGPYRIDSRIGAGGMGEVYRAWDDRLDRWVAIKQILPAKAEDQRVRARLRREARAAARLGHPAIVQVYDLLETKQGDWIVNEFIEGKTLRTLVDQGQLELGQALSLTREIADGLGQAHAQGIVHRDLKTENVMVTPAGHAKILDFGIAKRLDSGPQDTTLSVEGSVLGTVRAMSPEQALGDPVDHRSDLFSLGTLLYETLTGKSPFQVSNTVETLSRICCHRQTPAREVREEVPEELSALIDQLLEKDPNHRPQSAAEVADALGHLAGLLMAEGPATEGVFSGAVTHTLTDRPALRKRATPATTGRALTRGRVRLLTAAGLAVLFLVIAGGFFSRRWSTLAAPRPAIAVLGFKNLGSPDAAWLSTALAELLSSELGADGQLRLIPGESIARMKVELGLTVAETLAPDTLGAIRRNLGTDYVVVGSYLLLDESEDKDLRLVLRLQDTRSGEQSTVNRTGTEAELFDLVGQTATVVRQELGVRELAPAEAEAVQATLSSNREAARLYAEGLAKLRQYEALAARDLLLEAVAADPDYGLAHARLSEAWLALGYDQQAEQSARRAFELREGLPRESELLVQGQYYESSSEWQQAEEVYQLLRDFFPDNVEYGLSLARVRVGAGRFNDALAIVESLHELPPPVGDDPRIDLAESWAARWASEFERSLAAAEEAIRKGESQGTWILAAEARLRQAWALDRLGRRDQAAAAAEEAREGFAKAGDRSKEAQALDLKAWFLESQGDFTNAEKIFRNALLIQRQTGNRREVRYLLNHLGLLKTWTGDPAAAQAAHQEALVIARELGDRFGEAVHVGAMADVLADQGDLAAAKGKAQEALAILEELGYEGEALIWYYYFRGKIAYLGGELGDARSLLERARELGDKSGSALVNGYVALRLGQIQLAQGDLVAARELVDDCRAIWSQGGQQAFLGEAQLTRARLLLAEERSAQAEGLAREARGNLLRAGRVDLEAMAAATLAHALALQDKLTPAREALAGARARAERTQNPTVRIAVAIAEARVLAAGEEYAEALRTLGSALGEAQEFGFLGQELEVRLVVGEIEMAAGVAGPAAAITGHARLDALAEEAEEKGFGLIARKAATASRQRAS